LEIGALICLRPQWVIQYVNLPAAQLLCLDAGKLAGRSLLNGVGNNDLSVILKKLVDNPPLTEVIYQQGEQTWSIEWKEWLPEQVIVIIQKIKLFLSIAFGLVDKLVCITNTPYFIFL